MFINLKNKIKYYFENNKDKCYLVLLLIIILLGTIFRISHLDKTALTDDETYCYYLAKQSFPFGILNTIFNHDIHAPLYFFILHFWMKLFGENDVILRLLSVIFGIINIPVGYFIGKKLISKQLGVLIAAFISFNGLLIYYSQEVKFYSLLPLLVSFSFLYLIDILKKEKTRLKSYAGLILSNLAILYTYTFGVIFVFFQAFLFFVYLIVARRSFKEFLYSQFIIFGFFSPYLIVFIPNNIINYSKTIFDVIPWAGRLSFAGLFAYIQNLFSPVLISLTKVPDNDYLLVFLSFFFSPIFFMFVIFPIITYLAGIYKSLVSKNCFIILTFLTGLLFIIVEVILTLAGKFAILPRYMILSLIPFVIVACYGLFTIKSKKIKSIIISVFLISNVLFLLLSPFSPQNIQREGKGKLVAELVEESKANTGDIIILPPYGRSLNKYSNINNQRQIYFDVLRSSCIDMLLGENIATTMNKDNSYAILTNYIANPLPSKEFDNYFKTNIVNQLKTSEKFILFKDKDIAVFTREQIDYQLNVNPSAFYPQLSRAMFHMLNSKAMYDFQYLGNKYLKVVNIKETSYFVVYVFEKV